MGHLMNWYEWNSLADFDLWHDALCLQLGYPIYGVNEATGQIDETTQPTTIYTNAFCVADKFIAIVGDDYLEGLTVTELRPPKPEKYDETEL
jgi:hypothetical protein